MHEAPFMDNIGAKGDLNNDMMVREFLTHHNTAPRRGMQTITGTATVWQTTEGHLALSHKKPGCFHKPPGKRPMAKHMASEGGDHAISVCEDNGDTQEAFLHSTLVKMSLYKNQSGNFPGKWDRSGIVIESKGHEQFVVKVAGTGRLTLRNRRFLRIFTPCFLQGPTWKFERPS